MSAHKLLGVGVLVVLVGAAAQGQDKTDYAKLIVGKWEVSKADEGTVPKGSTVEFGKDGKMKVSVKEGGQEQTLEGTYKVEKNTFTFTIKGPDGQEHMQTITITKASEKEMSTKDKEGKVVEMKKK
jgi:uncharacterized protein (TIGR03066 family)